MRSALRSALLLSALAMAPPAFAGEGAGKGVGVDLSHADILGVDGGRMANANGPAMRRANGERMSDTKADAGSANAAPLAAQDRADRRDRMSKYILTSPQLRVSAYRVVLPDTLSDDDEAKASDKERKAHDDLAVALAGATQDDARRRLAALGDVSTALPVVVLNASDDERDTLVLSADTRAYVKTVDGIPGQGEVGNVGYVRTGDRIRFHGVSTKDGYAIEYEAESRHLNQMDHYSTGASSLDIPNVTNAKVNGELDLAAIGAKPVSLGATAVAGPRPVGFAETEGRSRHVTAVMLTDTADTGGRTVLIYVVSHAD